MVRVVVFGGLQKMLKNADFNRCYCVVIKSTFLATLLQLIEASLSLFSSAPLVLFMIRTTLLLEWETFSQFLILSMVRKTLTRACRLGPFLVSIESQQQLLSVASCASHDGVRRFLGGYWQGTRGNHRCRSQFWSLPDHNFVAKLSQQPMQRQQMSTGLKVSDAVADGDFLLTNAAAYLFFIRNF